LRNLYELIFLLFGSFKSLFVLKKEKNPLAQYLKIGLVVIFSFLYLPHAFILIQDINLISAFEVDPGSIVASINDLFNKPIYNMLNGYHSKFYGWTYFSINFLLLTPLKILLYLFGIKSQTPILFAIKIIYFSIGLLMALAFYQVLNKLSRDRLLIINFLFSILFIVSSVHHVFYFIHPESTGALFIFLGISSLLLFIKEGKLLLYYIGVIFLVMASLAKQTFFIAALPILFCFIDGYRKKINMSPSPFLTSSHFFKLLKNTFYLSLLVFFIIHPYAFVKPIEFLKFQYSLSQSFSSAGDVGYLHSINSWVGLIKYNPLMYFSFVSLPLVIPFAFFMYKKSNLYEYFLVSVNGIAAFFIFLFVAYGNRLVYSDAYLFPCYLFLFFNIFGIVQFLIIETKKFKFLLFREFFYITSIGFFVFLIAVGIKSTLHDSLRRLDYKNSIAFRTYEYINNNVKPGDKIAHDHFVAVPSNMNNISCHFWHGCGTDYIEEFNPTYVMFNPIFSFNGKSVETERLAKYVKDHNMVLIGKITSLQFNVVDVGINNNDNSVGVLIYKKGVSR
jgi:hypothetical protein